MDQRAEDARDFVRIFRLHGCKVETALLSCNPGDFENNCVRRVVRIHENAEASKVRHHRSNHLQALWRRFIRRKTGNIATGPR